MNRRGLITGLVSLVAAPAIVRATSLMPVRGIILPLDGTPLIVQTVYCNRTIGTLEDLQAAQAAFRTSIWGLWEDCARALEPPPSPLFP